MAAGGNPHANRTSVRLKEFITAPWGIVTPNGLSCFQGTLFEIQRNTSWNGIHRPVHSAG